MLGLEKRLDRGEERDIMFAFTWIGEEDRCRNSALSDNSEECLLATLVTGLQAGWMLSLTEESARK